MKQLLNFITLGVDDLDKVKKFYQEKFGWTPLKDSDGIAFFKLNGFILGLFPNNELAKDAGVPDDGRGFKRFTLAINFKTEQEVDKAFDDLKQKGVKIIKAPEKVFWGGYRGYIADIENNLWEIAYNPFLELDSEGNVVTHK
ncbi:MAG TPA: VOC family protein [Thermodesulfovibrionia bacterium]|nr:VOC family protein [Thermodesulfovibrionia bacterium]